MNYKVLLTTAYISFRGGGDQKGYTSPSRQIDFREGIKLAIIVRSSHYDMPTSIKTSTRAASKKAAGAKNNSANSFEERLLALGSAAEAKKMRSYFKHQEDKSGVADEFIGVRMGQVFALAKTFKDMGPEEIEKLLESPVHEIRVGAVSIMDFQARNAKTPESRRKELFDLYIRRHDRINNWDLVDRSAPYVVGGYLFDRPRTVLYKLARSKNVWERRTSIVSTYFFIRKGDVADTFKIAEMLVDDPHDLIHKAVGGWLREAGKKNQEKLFAFLDKHAAHMPRTALRYAIEKLNKKERDHYMSLGKRETGGGRRER